MRWLKQGPLSVWSHNNWTLEPTTTGSVNVGGAAVSEEEEQYTLNLHEHKYASTSSFIQPHTHARTHTHTHLYLYLYLYYHCKNWVCGPHSGGEPAEGNKTGVPIGSLTFPVAWPPQCSRGTHLWACKTHEMRGVGYGLE